MEKKNTAPLILMVLVVIGITAGGVLLGTTTSMLLTGNVVSENNDFCEDSDRGVFIKTLGTTSYGAELETDYCANEDSIHEFYCRDGELVSETFSCPEDTTCVNGACS